MSDNYRSGCHAYITARVAPVYHFYHRPDASPPASRKRRLTNTATWKRRHYNSIISIVPFAHVFAAIGFFSLAKFKNALDFGRVTFKKTFVSMISRVVLFELMCLESILNYHISRNEL